MIEGPGITKELQEKIKSFIEMVRENVRNHDMLMPILVAINSKTSKSAIIGMQMPGTFKEKELLASKVKELIKGLEADFCYVAIESYYLRDEDVKDYQANRDKYESVSKHPNAKEAVMFSIENRYQTWSALAELKGREFSSEVEFKIVQSSGPLTNFINLKVVLH